MSLTIISPGAQTTVQDLGRPGLRARGIPMGGAADRFSFIAANRRLGAPDNSPALEITLIGPEFIVRTNLTMAYAGAPVAVHVNDVLKDSEKPFQLSAGDKVRIGTLSHGVRGYLAVSKRLRADAAFGSCSTYLPGGFGGYKGRALQAGDEVEFGENLSLAPQSQPQILRSHLGQHQILRVCAGPEWERLTQASQTKLLSKPWTASPQTDRMGARLTGPKLALREKRQMVSSGLLPGTVQVPASGAPILSLVDSHCTGGYSRALRVIAPDLPRLGQIGPGTQIHFHRTSAEQARDILRRQNIWIAAK